MPHRIFNEGEVLQAIKSGARTFWKIMSALHVHDNDWRYLHMKMSAMRRKGRIWFDASDRTWKVNPASWGRQRD